MGVLVLPTEAEKLLLESGQLAGCNTPALVVVPTLDLLEQVEKQLEEASSNGKSESLWGGRKFFL